MEAGFWQRPRLRQCIAHKVASSTKHLTLKAEQQDHRGRFSISIYRLGNIVMVKLQARVCTVATERNPETTQYNSSLNARSHCGGKRKNIEVGGT